jgi:hypothetical protein
MTTNEPRQPPAQHPLIRPACPCGGHHAPQDADEVAELKRIAEALHRHSSGVETALRKLIALEEKRGRAA